jgi:DNA polymerase-3 subunit beta
VTSTMMMATNYLRLSMRAGDLARVLALATMPIDEKVVRHIASLAAIRIRAIDGEQVTIISNILDLGISVQTNADVAQQGELAVPGERLCSLIKALPKDENVTLSATETYVTITCGRGRWRLPLYAIADLPAPLEIREAAGAATLDTDTLLQLLDPAFAAGSEQSRFYLCGLYLHHSPNGVLTSVATNGTWLMRREVAGVGAELFDGSRGIIIPSKTIDIITKLVRTKPETVTLRHSKNLFALETAGVSVISKLVAGEFPDYRSVIPPPSKNTAKKLEKAALIAALNRLSTIAEEEKRLPGCILEWDDDDTVHLTARHPEDGEDAVAGETAGHARVLVASKRLAVLLNEFPGEHVHIELNGPGSVMKISRADDPEIIALLMPMAG